MWDIVSLVRLKITPLSPSQKPELVPRDAGYNSGQGELTWDSWWIYDFRYTYFLEWLSTT